VKLLGDGKTLLTGGADGLIYTWDVGTGKPLSHFAGQQTKGKAVALSPDQKVLATGSKDGAIHLWNLATTKEIRKFPAHKDAILTLAYSADGTKMASGGDDFTIALWDAATAKELRRLEGHQDKITWVAFSPNGKLLASGSEDYTIRLWDVGTGKELHLMVANEREVESLVFSPDGKTLVSGGRSGPIRFWDVATGEAIRQTEKNLGWVVGLTFSPDGKLLASGGSPRTVHLWEVATGKERWHAEGHGDDAVGFCFSADGRKLVSGSGDTTALVWDITGGLKDNLAAIRNGTQPGRLQTIQLSADKLDSLWKEVTGEDAVQAHRSMWTMIGTPEASVEFLKKKLQPVSSADARQIAKLIADLDNDNFVIRERAMNELEDIADLAETALRRILEGQPTPEVHDRVIHLLDQLQGTAHSPKRLGQLRGLEILGQIGSPDALQLIKTLAGGAPEASLTKQAKADLERLGKATVN
jgi:hypothetical protein